MHSIAWLTDLHLNFVDDAAYEALIHEVLGANVDSVLIGGDIAEAASVVSWLSVLERDVQLPTFLVLGNHDFYYGGIQSVRTLVDEFTADSDTLNFLTTAQEPVRLTERAGLVGHDGWADAR